MSIARLSAFSRASAGLRGAAVLSCCLSAAVGLGSQSPCGVARPRFKAAAHPCPSSSRRRARGCMNGTGRPRLTAGCKARSRAPRDGRDDSGGCGPPKEPTCSACPASSLRGDAIGLRGRSNAHVLGHAVISSCALRPLEPACTTSRHCLHVCAVIYSELRDSEPLPDTPDVRCRATRSLPGRSRLRPSARRYVG